MQPRIGRRVLVVGLALAACAGVVAVTCSSSGDGELPEVVWTREPLPSVAAVTAGPGLAPAEVRNGIDGGRIRGWDVYWAPRFGPVGGPQVIWRMFAIERIGTIESFLARFRGMDREPRWVPFDDTGETRAGDDATWRSWRRPEPIYGGPPYGEDR